MLEKKFIQNATMRFSDISDSTERERRCQGRSLLRHFGSPPQVRRKISAEELDVAAAALGRLQHDQRLCCGEFRGKIRSDVDFRPFNSQLPTLIKVSQASEWRTFVLLDFSCADRF